VDAFWSKRSQDVTARPFTPPPPPKGNLAQTGTYGYVIDGRSDAVPRALAMLFDRQVTVRAADEDFTAAARSFPRGSLLIRNHENGADLVDRLRAVARETGVTPVPVNTALSSGPGPDLGGGRFQLLAQPRVAVLSHEPIRTTAYGYVWHLLDAETRLRASSIPVVRLGSTDLRPYNVLIIPEARGSSALSRALEPHVDAIRAWVRSGGTVIAMGNAAAALTQDPINLSAVTLRRNALENLAFYEMAVKLERGVQPDGKQEDDENGDKLEERKLLDEWQRVFSPQGAILRAHADLEHWLTYGCGKEVPVFLEGSYAFLSRHPVSTPLRLAPADGLRLSGLLWPEAGVRLAGTAYATVERLGHGQIVLFASHPAFRAYFQTTSRVLLNAVLIGPGAGTQRPAPW
jgi:hypothetical protein